MSLLARLARLTERSCSQGDGAALCIMTGADAAHFANSKMLVSSCLRNSPGIPLVFCDFGLAPEQRRRLQGLKGVSVVAVDDLRGLSGWECKANLFRFAQAAGVRGRTIIWVDADAIVLRNLSAIGALIGGYEMLIDAHVQSVGEIVVSASIEKLGLLPADAYFSSGFWTVRHPTFLETWARLCDLVKFQGNLWENDAFVAAVYREKLKIRTVNGGVWHSRGMTSLDTCEVVGGEVFHRGQPVVVLHANARYSLREDQRRVFSRVELAAIQDAYEGMFDELAGS